MDDISQTTFSNAFSWMKMYEFRLTEISLKFVLKVGINNIPTFVQIMAWRRPGDKPLSEPRMVSLPTHICVTRPQWVKVSPPGPIRTDNPEGTRRKNNVIITSKRRPSVVCYHCVVCPLGWVTYSTKKTLIDWTSLFRHSWQSNIWA